MIDEISTPHAGPQFLIPKEGRPVAPTFSRSALEAPAHPSFRPPKRSDLSDLMLQRFQPGMQFLQSKLQARFHCSQRIPSRGRDLAMTHSCEKRELERFALKRR